MSATGNRLCRAGALLVAFIAMPPEPAPLRAQSAALRDIFDKAASAVQTSAVRQPFADDAEETVSEAESVNLPRPAERRSSRKVRLAQAARPEMEDLPPPRVEGKLPLAGSPTGDGIELSENDKGLITLVVRDASLSQVLALLAQTQQLNIVAAKDIDAVISITLRQVPLEEALTAILSVANYTWVKRNNIILITSLTEAASLPADVQGRQIQVFDLDFASAQAVAESVSGFLSPIGKVTVSESSPTDNRLTRELVIVEDLPDSLARIANYIYEVDRPPRQVLIEAHVLQVTLDDNTKCGVNLDALARLSNSRLSIQTPGLASSTASPAFLATLEGGDLGGIIEMIQATTDSKTLGSPKVLVLNEQEARIQVGDQIGYLGGTTQTELVATQEIQFLEVGVVLRVIPRITRDNRVLLHVKPEVSTGQINPVTQAPDKSTSELETSVMLDDGQGMVIGGLIKETDSVTQSKVPYLGDVKGIGWFFRRSELTKTRVEIIVALVPRVQPYDCEWAAYEQGELARASVPLLNNRLQRNFRPWDPVLPDGKRVYKPAVPRQHRGRRLYGPYYDEGGQYVVPPYPLPEQQLCEPPCEEPLPPSRVRARQPSPAAERLPMPAFGEWSVEDIEIISDQPQQSR